MKNIRTEVRGDILTITVDLSEDFGPSKSGKTTIVASSEGNVPVANGIRMGLNVFKG